MINVLKNIGVLEDYGQALLRFDKANHHEANVVLLLPLQVKCRLITFASLKFFIFKIRKTTNST